MPQSAASENSERPTPHRLALERRRAQVWDWAIVRKIRIVEIAELLSVSRSTVERDIAAQRSRMRSLLRQQRASEAGLLDAAMDALSETDAVARAAWADHVSLPAGSSQRSKFLNLVLGSTKERVRVLAGLGLLSPAAVADEMAAFDVARLSDEEIRLWRELLQMVQLAAAANLRDAGAADRVVRAAVDELRRLAGEGEGGEGHGQAESSTPGGGS